MNVPGIGRSDRDGLAGEAAGAGTPPEPQEPGQSASAVLRNRPFLLLWLSQVATQIGGNMVIYGLTVIIFSSTRSNAAVSLLLLTFLVPAVVFSAVAGVYVDRIDRRVILVATNAIRGLAFVVLYLVGDNVALIYLLNIAVSIATTLFAPAEAAMIPVLVPRGQLLQANGIFTLTLNAAFALGFALFGPLVVTIAGPAGLLLLVAVLYLVAAGFCFTLPGGRAEPEAGPAAAATGTSATQAVADVVIDAEKAVESTVGQLQEGLKYIGENRTITWSLVYLGITASLIGVLGVLGPAFATNTLGLAPKDFVVVVLPLGFGIVTGILLLNSYGRLVPRRRLIEGGLISLGVLLAILSVAGPITLFLQHRVTLTGQLTDINGLISLLSIVVGIAFVAGISYAVVAIPSQTQLQEDLPEDVRGRVFGVLNMLVSVASFVPIIIVGPISDVVGTTAVILTVAALIAASGIASIVLRGPLPAVQGSGGEVPEHPFGPVDHVAVAYSGSDLRRADFDRRQGDRRSGGGPASPAAAESEDTAATAGGPSAVVDDDGGPDPATADGSDGTGKRSSDARSERPGPEAASRSDPPPGA